VVAQFSRHNGHPRFFGYVASPGVAVATAASAIAAAMNINVTSCDPVRWRRDGKATVGWLRR